MKRFFQTVTISPEALSQEVGGETVILDLRSESYFGLDEIGTHIWQLLQEQKSLQLIFDQMLSEYDVNEDQLENDINALLDEFLQAELITIEDQHAR